MTHTCHWPGCPVEVPRAMWGCKRHWYRLPVRIRRRILATYQPGQESGRVKVSREYLNAALEARVWIGEQR